VLEATLLASDGKHKQADELLAALDQSLSTDERKRIERLRLEVMAASNNLAGAFQRVQRLIEVDAKDVGLLSIGIDVALGAGELKAAEVWERKLRELTDDSSQVDFLRARRLLLSFQQLPVEEKKKLGRSIIELRTERPTWYPAVALAAQYAQLQRDLRQAITDYSLAVELGDRRPATLQQLITLLYKEGRFEDAQKYLSYRTANSKLFDPFFDTMAVELAVKQDRSAEALEMARKSVERFPDDPMLRITLANLLIRYGQTQQGLEVLREAARSFKDDSRVWLGLFSALVQTGQTDDARRTLAALVKSSFLPPQQRYLVAAQGHELLGESEAAGKLYKLAIAQDPEQPTVRLKYAKLLSRTDPKAARSEYERVLQQEPANGEARRDLATLLAATRQEADWKRITDLLATTGGVSTSDAITNDRLRAMLLSQKGRSRKERVANCQTARGILQRLIETETAGADNLTRLLIARILEQEAALSDDPSLLLAARDQLRLVVDRAPSTPEKLSLLIEFLLRHGVRQAADSLENAASEEPRSDIARQAEEFLSEAETRLGDLRQLQASGGNERNVLPVAFQARLLNARGREDDAKALIAEYAAGQTQQDHKDNNKAEQYLTIGRLYSSIGAHAEAEKWYRRLMKLNRNGYVLVAQSLMAQDKRKEAVEFCLSVSEGKPSPEIATLLASVMTATEKPVAELPDVQAAIEATMDDHSENIELLQAEAVRRASRGRYEDSIALFRRILAINPDHALTLNNLATMLAERPNQRAEALEHIQRAIEIGGRQAVLLDTQGTILFKIGETEQAIDCLEEATAGEAADARFYLHLAAAYHQAQREDDARRILAEARALGLEKFVLTGDDRKMLVTLDKLFSQVPGTP
jgi:predicted Zn-dependent protease